MCISTSFIVTLILKYESTMYFYYIFFLFIYFNYFILYPLRKYLYVIPTDEFHLIYFYKIRQQTLFQLITNTVKIINLNLDK